MKLTVPNIRAKIIAIASKWPSRVVAHQGDVLTPQLLKDFERIKAFAEKLPK